MEDMSAMDYEILLRRAYNCDRFKNGADADIYRGLQEDEFSHKEDLANKKIQTAYNRTLNVVKHYIIDALNHAIVRRLAQSPSQKNNDKILDCIPEIDGAKNTADLSSVIRKALDLFIELKIELS